MKTMVMSTFSRSPAGRTASGTRLGVERAEGLVHEQDARLVGEGAGDGDALFHAAGELVRIGVFEFRESDEFDPFAGLGLGGGRGRPAMRSPNMTFSFTVSQGRGCSPGRPCRGPDRDRRRVLRRRGVCRMSGFQPCQNADKGGLAATGWPDDAEKLALVDGEDRRAR